MLHACDTEPARVVGPLSPVLVESRGTTNIVHFRGRYYALPQSLGPVDFGQPDLSDIPFLAVSESLTVLGAMLKKA
jgi:hypothetical protein